MVYDRCVGGGWWEENGRGQSRAQSRTATGKAATVKMASKGKLKTTTSIRGSGAAAKKLKRELLMSNNNKNEHGLAKKDIKLLFIHAYVHMYVWMYVDVCVYMRAKE